MNTISAMIHHVDYIDKHHGALLTMILVIWIVCSWVGERARSKGSTIVSMTLAVAALIPVIIALDDLELGLFAVQIPILVWRGVRRGCIL